MVPLQSTPACHSFGLHEQVNSICVGGGWAVRLRRSRAVYIRSQQCTLAVGLSKPLSSSLRCTCNLPDDLGLGAVQHRRGPFSDLPLPADPDSSSPHGWYTFVRSYRSSTYLPLKLLLVFYHLQRINKLSACHRLGSGCLEK